MDITCENLREFCRLCLRSLMAHNDNDNARYNLQEMPQLKKFLQCITALKFFGMDDLPNYPSNLCELCYHKLIDFEEFQCMILVSAQRIEDILKSISVDDAPTIAGVGTLDLTKISTTTNCNEDSDDDKLLLPDLEDWMPNVTIKSEPIDQSNTTPSSPHIKTEIEIKNEVYSEDEEDEDSENYNYKSLYSGQLEVSEDSSTSEESALGTENVFALNFQNQNRRKSSSSSNAQIEKSKRDRNRKSLQCPRCDKHVYKQVYLDAHIRSVHEGQEKPFQCSQCQKAFTRYNQLFLHIQSNHVRAIKFFCDFVGCDASFKMSQSLDAHRKVVHPGNPSTTSVRFGEFLQQNQQNLPWNHFCNECGKNFSSKRTLSEHLKRHAQIKEHICQVCGVAKVTRTELHTHMRTHDSTLEKFKCTQCPQEFNHKNAISRHIRVVHEGERKFNCDFCPRRFGTRNSKVCHERLHTGERPFKCASCPKGFAQMEGLKSHMKSHDKNLRKHICKFCKQRFITRKNLEHHEQRHTGNKPHICTTCGRGFYNPRDLEIHSILHEKESRNHNKKLGNSLQENQNMETDESSEACAINDMLAKNDTIVKF